jgi:hypothetical protein
MTAHGELELTAQRGKALERGQSTDPMISMMERAIFDPTFDVEKLERIFALKERHDAQSRKEAFETALLEVQKRVGRVEQNGLMNRGTGGQIPYAKREDIDAVARPIYQEYGFTVTWDYPMADDGNIHVTGYFSAHGHTEKRVWVCKPDPSGGKTGPQATSSTGAYGKRQISKMMWDIIEVGKDQNGAKAEELISESECLDLQSAIEEVNGDKLKFLKRFDVSAFREMTKSKLKQAHLDIDAKRRAGK